MESRAALQIALICIFMLIVSNGVQADSYDYNYLALHDQSGPSGVPLGGIGSGCVQFAPDGHFTRTGGINNWSTESATAFRGQNQQLENSHFLAIWDRVKNNETVVRRLQRDTLTTCGISGFAHSTYRGLFPVAEASFNDDTWPTASAATVRIWSGLAPHELSDSTLPCFWVEVTVANNVGSRETSVAMSWADLIGRGLLEPIDLDKIPTNPEYCNQSYFREIPRQTTTASAVSCSGWQGVLQTVSAPLPAPTKLTFQTGVSQVMILAEPQSDAQISILPAYRLDGASTAWASFCKNGDFGGAPTSQSPLSDPTESSASAVAIKVTVPSGGKRTFRFLVAWYAPPVPVDPSRADDPRYRYGTGDYGTWYQNRFAKVDDVATSAIAARERVWGEIRDWQDPILNSNLPDWLQFKLINSTYTLYTNTILNRAGDFSIMEGGMGGLAATMDVRNIVHPLYQKFFPDLNRREIEMFSSSQEPEVYPNGTKNDPRRVGAISHMLGNYFMGLASPKTPGPCTMDVTLDGTCGYIMQIVEDYQQTGDTSWLKSHEANILKVLAYLKNNIVDNRGIPDGRATYDDYNHPPVFAFNASMFLMGLEAAIRAGTTLGNQQMVADAVKMRDVAQRGYMSLWNGRFFAYGALRNSSVLVSDRFHQGQIGGQSMARFCGWDDVVPMSMQNAVFTSQCKLVLSKVPDYYADKVWDVEMGRGVDQPGSRCWPFQLEAFTAMPMIQAGWIDDGFDIMRHMQLVHLRKGYTWSQNLWNPGEVTRMDAPVTWMVLDNLAGAALDVPNHRLILGPGVLPSSSRLTIPLYFPNFWAVLDYRPADRKGSLRITRVFGDSPIKFSKLTGRPMGEDAKQAKTVSIPEFDVKEGAVLDLSPYMNIIGPPVIHPGILSHAADVPFVDVSAGSAGK